MKYIPSDISGIEFSYLASIMPLLEVKRAATSATTSGAKTEFVESVVRIRTPIYLLEEACEVFRMYDPTLGERSQPLVRPYSLTCPFV